MYIYGYKITILISEKEKHTGIGWEFSLPLLRKTNLSKVEVGHNLVSIILILPFHGDSRATHCSKDTLIASKFPFS